jgi:PAS domain S-box-containing protein
LETLIKIQELIEQNKVLEKRNEELRNIIDINLNKKTSQTTLQPSEILSKQEIESLVFNFFQKFKMPASVYDMNGTLLFSIGWKKICIKLNQISEITCFNEVSQFLTKPIPGKYIQHQCKQGFNLLAFPLELKNKTIGVLIFCQFFIHDKIPNPGLFEDFLSKSNMGNDEFMTLLSEVPVYQVSELENIIQQGLLLSEMISFVANKNHEFYKRFNHQLENEQVFKAIKQKIAEQEEIIQSLIRNITQHHDDIQENTVPKSVLKKEIKSLNKKLDHTETILNSILTSIPLGIAFIKKNTVTYANDQIFKLTGYTIKEVIGRNPGYFLEEPNLVNEITSLTAGEFIEKEKTIVEVTLKKKNNSTCKALAFISPYDIHKPEEGYTMSFLDISENKRIQNEMIVAKEKAEESDKLKNAFLLNMSHEIRSPLNAILGFTNLLNSDIITDQQKSEYISIIETNSKRLMRMIDDIIDMSYISTDQLQIQCRHFPLHSLLTEIYESFTDYIEEKRLTSVSLKLSIPYRENPGAFYVFNDDIRLKQVITSMLRNSLRFTQQGQIEFGYELASDGKITFFVKDTGEGIKADQLANLFHFYDKQPQESYTQQFGGTSLGLTISKKLIEIMGGEIWAESQYTQGTKIFFTLPGPISSGAKQTITVNESIKSKFQHDWHEKTILVAEDEEVNFLYIQKLLQHTNIKIKWAENGQKAVDYFDRDPNINLVLMDIKMPVMNGIEATKYIKSKNKGIPVVAQTAYVHDANKKEIMDAGCDEFIPKPINSKFFISVLEKFLS